MSSFFIETPPENNIAVILGDEAHHIVKVRRIGIGESIQLFDSEGHVYQAVVTETTKKKVTCEIHSQKKAEKKFPIDFYLVQSLTKSKVWDVILQKAMELNLEHLIPVVSENTAAGSNSSGKAERWQKIILAAAKQCEQPALVNIHPLQSFNDAIDAMTEKHLVLIAHTEKGIPSLKHILSNHRLISSLAIVIGPEGGLSDKEISYALDKGAELFTLGESILRAETAAIATIANIYFYFSQ